MEQVLAAAQADMKELQDVQGVEIAALQTQLVQHLQESHNKCVMGTSGTPWELDIRSGVGERGGCPALDIVISEKPCAPTSLVPSL